MKTAIYDMAKQPATYDIAPFVATVGAMTAGDRVRFVVLADRFRDSAEKDKALSFDQKRARARNIIVPVCWLLPTATDVRLVTSRGEADEWRKAGGLAPSTFVKEVTRQWEAGRDVRRFTSPVRTEFDGAVVITIRQTSVVPAKNCNMEIWLGAAERIQVAGHRVVLVPDTDMESRPLPSGFEWCREAATSVSLRAGLYQNAMCSLSMGIGPMATAMFMPSTRYAMFVNHRSGGTTQRQLFERVFGVRWGQQLPFAGAGQVIEYREDDEDAILDAFHRSISGRQAA